jgi:hypothetical protein
MVDCFIVTVSRWSDVLIHRKTEFYACPAADGNNGNNGNSNEVVVVYRTVKVNISRQ